MSRKIPASTLVPGMTVLKRNSRREITRTIRVNDVSRNCAAGGTHINELSLADETRCFDALAVVEVK